VMTRIISITLGVIFLLKVPVQAGEAPQAETVEDGRLYGPDTPVSVREKDPSTPAVREEEDSPYPFWNWSDKDVVTPVKNQGDTLACSVYTLSSHFESAMIMQENLLRQDIDIDENYLVELTGTEEGGNAMTVISHMAREGTVMAEEEEPVNRIIQWEILTFGETPSAELLQEYLLDVGPLYTDVYFGEPESDDREFIQNYDGREALGAADEENGEPIQFDEVTHSVLLVGWDDDYLPPPPSPQENPGGDIEIDLDEGNEVFIVKNSWGQDWADRGYGYIQAGHLNLGQYTSFISGWRKPHKQESVIAFDEGYTDALGYSGEEEVFGLIEYSLEDTAPGTVYVHGFDIWVPGPVGLEMRLFDGFDKSQKDIQWDTKLVERGFDAPRAGFYSVDFPSPVRVSTEDPEKADGSPNHVYLKYLIRVEDNDIMPLLTYKGSERQNTSFVSSDGESWYCINNPWMVRQYGDLAVRLRYSPVRTSVQPTIWDGYQ